MPSPPMSFAYRKVGLSSTLRRDSFGSLCFQSFWRILGFGRRAWRFSRSFDERLKTLRRASALASISRQSRKCVSRGFSRLHQFALCERSARWVSLTVKHYVSILKIEIRPDDKSHVTEGIPTGLRCFRCNDGSRGVARYGRNVNAPFCIVIIGLSSTAHPLIVSPLPMFLSITASVSWGLSKVTSVADFSP